ncbi:hypothetical protein [Cystobacter ferrugineus]|uniref:Uncharacterized protein n=1 Tax=Cystobacter ferrugineus TaxID=83449 RepID=A0A1L9BCX0_9BACT|nr:hypothetical protein [Cystobacter ferrugineus]OJH40112.1 hypothetical protein BON30_13715 [Cystobacter ferrugineus]
MKTLPWLKAMLEYLGGVTDAPPDGSRPLSPLELGLFWGLLMCAILAFSGQASKFIYIDF